MANGGLDTKGLIHAHAVVVHVGKVFVVDDIKWSDACHFLSNLELAGFHQLGEVGLNDDLLELIQDLLLV